MQLTEEQRTFYGSSGFLFLPGYFSVAEIDWLRVPLATIFAEDTPRRVFERDRTTVRSVFGSHETHSVFRDLVREPRLVRPARELLGADVYVHQFKLNAKEKFSGDLWAWHQDFIFWLREDGIATPAMTTAILFLDEVTEFNGPLFLIPSSHTEGVIETQGSAAVPEEYAAAPTWISNLIADIKYPLQREIVARSAREHGIVSVRGAAGSVLFFHPNTFHASPPNLSPFDRVLALVTYNSVHNRPRRVNNPRPDFLCGRNYAPIECEEMPRL